MNYDNWTDYFKRNAAHLLPVDWNNVQPLGEQERRTMARSVAIFQRGESSDGSRLKGKAQRYLALREDKSYYAALCGLINEEHRHAYDLGRFLDAQQLPKVEAHWTDDIFRMLRGKGGLETAVMVLLTAELIAAVYYDALRKATNNVVLKQLCTQIISDEARHITFQAAGLSQFHMGRTLLLNRLMTAINAVLLAGACCVVWRDHRRVLKAGGYSFFRFVKGSFFFFFRAQGLLNKQVRAAKAQRSKDIITTDAACASAFMFS